MSFPCTIYSWHWREWGRAKAAFVSAKLSSFKPIRSSTVNELHNTDPFSVYTALQALEQLCCGQNSDMLCNNWFTAYFYLIFSIKATSWPASSPFFTYMSLYWLDISFSTLWWLLFCNIMFLYFIWVTFNENCSFKNQKKGTQIRICLTEILFKKYLEGSEVSKHFSLVNRTLCTVRRQHSVRPLSLRPQSRLANLLKMSHRILLHFIP